MLCNNGQAIFLFENLTTLTDTNDAIASNFFIYAW